MYGVSGFFGLSPLSALAAFALVSFAYIYNNNYNYYMKRINIFKKEV
jgi:hypothetical protein